MAAEPETTPASRDEGEAIRPASPTEAGPTRRRHRLLVGVLIGLAFVIGIVATFSIWINRELLNTDNWANTSSELLADSKIQTTLGNYLVAQLFDAVDVQAEIQGILPPGLSGLSGPAAGGLREVAEQAAPALLASEQVQSAWRQANVAAHRELLRILNGGHGALSTKNGVVSLDLASVIEQLAGELGFSSQAAAARQKLSGGTAAKVSAAAQQKLGITLPPNIGQLVILRSSQLKTAQDIASAIRGLALWLTVITIALFALAVWLAQGWRRVALRSVGWCFIAVGVLVALVRRVAGDAIVNGLVQAPDNRPAAHDAWTIGTSLLHSIAVAEIVYGILLVLAAALAGHTRPAVAIRRALAPELRERQGIAYGVAAGLLLLVVLWGPTPAFREVLPLLIIIALVALGIHALRVQAVAEFPEAELGDTQRRLHAAWAARRHGFPRGRGAGDSAPSGGPADRVAALERLTVLHERGVLTDAEFASEKTKIMSGP